MAVLAVLFVGPKKLPELARIGSRWSPSDWALVVAAALSGAFAFALLTAPTR